MWPVDHERMKELQDLLDESLLSAFRLADSHKHNKPPNAYEFIWLMASIAAALEECFLSGSDQFSVLKAAFDRRSVTSSISDYMNRPVLQARLCQDLEVWKTIARVTGLQNAISAWIADFPLEVIYPLVSLEPVTHEADEMASLVKWLMGNGIHERPRIDYHAASDAFALKRKDLEVIEVKSAKVYAVADSLCRAGIQIETYSKRRDMVNRHKPAVVYVGDLLLPQGHLAISPLL